MSNTKTKNAPVARHPESSAAGTGKSLLQTEHIPETAENFEHTIRRLVIKKEKQRSKSFGLYR